MIEDEISTFLDAYMVAWNKYDVAEMRALWDGDEATPIYVAEEKEPHIGWAAIEGYWGVDRSLSERLITWRDLIAKEAAPGLAVIFYITTWQTYIPNSRLYPKPFGGPARVSAALRRKPDGWKLFHYVEAPLASMVQLRQHHEAAVDPELHARLAAKGITY